ncbi:MAG: hypothetical protein A2286_05730 [Gammaproteobacteria bacterium RIFOXYA12_FULL_61_12]|nr:MAG: hypothetical protein A2286_05730 [Gammaproteobacteria bacterium RIFOXYA12_FULL_61_12]
MEQRKIEISPSCHFVATRYGNGIRDVALEYTEHSPDSWYSDREISLDLDRVTAMEIVQFLREEFAI